MNMISNTVLGLFLYFPEDKTEYIPAVITSIFFLSGAIITWRLVMYYSKKQESKLKQMEQQIMQQEKERHL